MSGYFVKKNSFLRKYTVQLHWQIRGLLVRYPVYRLVSRLRHREKSVNENTDIIIDGFPRSGNTFAVTAFKFAQPGPSTVSSHIHAPIEIITAVRRGIPAIVLIRDPEDAAISFMIMLAENVSAKAAFDYYIRFYESLLPYKDRFVTCPFEVTTGDFGAAISAVNDKCGSSFAVFEHTAENADRCFDIIDAEYKEWRGEIRELNVSRPSDSRKDIKNRLRELLRQPEVRETRERAYGIYQEFLQYAVSGNPREAA